MATDGAVAASAAGAISAEAADAAAAINTGEQMEPPPSPETTELPIPTFFHQHRRGLHRTTRMASQDLADWRSISRSSSRAGEDPWLWSDPWMQ